jgi:molecular chaperone GrpE (heat shock protein)
MCRLLRQQQKSHTIQAEVVELEKLVKGVITSYCSLHGTLLSSGVKYTCYIQQVFDPHLGQIHLQQNSRNQF